jgi:hypothetical protein
MLGSEHSAVFFLEWLQPADFANKGWTSKALELGLHSDAEPESLNLWSQQDCRGKLTAFSGGFWDIGLHPSSIASGKKCRKDAADLLSGRAMEQCLK